MNILDIFDLNDENRPIITAVLDARFDVKDDVLFITCKKKTQLFIESSIKRIIVAVDKKIGVKIQRTVFVSIENGSEAIIKEEQRKKTIAQGLLIPAVLNPEYTFENFILSTCNQVAMAAVSSTMLAGVSGQRFLTIFGNSGFGKTHLLQAVAHELLMKGNRIVYFNGDTFINFMVQLILDHNSMRVNTTEQNVKKADALFVDDIQFISGKFEVQNELKNILDYFRDSRKFVFISSDKPPAKLEKVKEEIIGRLEEANVTEIERPDYELKYAILLRELGGKYNLDISHELLDEISQFTFMSVREIFLVANTIANYASQNISLNSKLINQVLKKVGFNPISVAEFKTRNLIKELNLDYPLEKLQGRVSREQSIIRKNIIIELSKRNLMSNTEIAGCFHISRQLVSMILRVINKEKD